MRDVDGQTTLHASVKKCYPKITSILLAAADPKGLQMETTVGNTILDIASLNEFNPRIRQFSEILYPKDELRINDVNPFYRYPNAYIQQLEKELPKLHTILDVLFADGRLKSQTKLATELTKFAKMMGERLSAAKAAKAAHAPQPPKEEEIVIDVYDPQATLSAVLAALKNVTVSRQLVHLIDVQKSVGTDLEKVNLPSDYWRRQKVEDESEAKQSDEDGKEKSMVWQYIPTSADPI